MHLHSVTGIEVDVWCRNQFLRSHIGMNFDARAPTTCILENVEHALWGRAWASWYRNIMSLMSDVTHQVKHPPTCYKKVFAVGFFPLDSCRAGMDLNQTFILAPGTIIVNICMHVFICTHFWLKKNKQTHFNPPVNGEWIVEKSSWGKNLNENWHISTILKRVCSVLQHHFNFFFLATGCSTALRLWSHRRLSSLACLTSICSDHLSSCCLCRWHRSLAVALSSHSRRNLSVALRRLIGVMRSPLSHSVDRGVR